MPIRDTLTPEIIAQWDMAISVALMALWSLWAIVIWEDVRDWLKSRAAANVVVGCLCKTRHVAGDCPRDRDLGGE